MTACAVNAQCQCQQPNLDFHNDVDDVDSDAHGNHHYQYVADVCDAVCRVSALKCL